MSDFAEPSSRSRYQTITTLGQGGMARVLLTMSRGPAGVTKLLVVKELKDELKADPEFVTMFLDEARIAARLNHPNVIQTYEVSTDGALPVIVMEYLEGQSLSAILGRVGRKKMPLDLHLYVLAQTAAGLHYAHELKSLEGEPLGLVHRDVSPHNVFVTYDGLVKLVDFGIAKAADSAGMTRAGTFKGKVGYAAPEQLVSGTSIDRRADVFALGVMLWEALAQRRLTFGETEPAVMHRRATGGDPKIKSVAPDVPDELAAICDKAMASNPDDRYATAAELRAAIEGWLDTSKRVGAEDVGALVRETFAADRERVQSLVETQVKALKVQSTTGEFAPPSLTDAASTQRRDPADTRDSTLKVATQSAPSAAAVKPDAGRGRLLVAAGIAVAIAVVGLSVLRNPSGAATPAASAGTQAAPQIAPTPVATVDVWISAEPAEARIYLDDAALGANPFHGSLAKSTLTRRLRVTAPGFAADERMVTLDRDLRLELSLKPAPAAASATPLPAAPSPRGAPPAAKAAAPGPTGPAPGEALTPEKAKKSTRSIDDTF
jgi:serine/threonine-protein kinase